MSRPIWTPSEERIQKAQLTAFRRRVEAETGAPVPDYRALHRFSVENKETFWRLLADFSGVRAQTWGEVVLKDGDKLPGARWFPQARLNFAENLLGRRDDADAVVFWGEGGHRRRLSYADLYAEVGRVARGLREVGVKPGDRVCGYLPNLPETLIAMLGAASVGATWSSCSPDFGVQGVLDRFGQIEPRVLFCADGYFYGGKSHDSLAKTRGVLEKLPSVERVVVVPYMSEAPDLSGVPNATTWRDFAGSGDAGDIPFVHLPFNHPLFVMFSSGTTGKPKCIVHGAGGTLLKHICEHQLHCDVQPGDRVFYFTTCGWMMWNWLVSALASKATLLLYDGQPFSPRKDILFDYADAEGMTLFGTSAKYIDALRNFDVHPARTHSLETVRVMTSTGSPLAPESFDYVYASIKKDLHLASISGGTDIIGCFVAGVPTEPVWRGEIQGRGLGMDVHVFDDEGRSVRQQKGELVCKNAFPSMPVGFWNDPGDARYRKAYFERFPGVWCHGDFAEITEHDGMIIYGRSDAVLNPGGVRIGTAEIYRVVEQMDEVAEAICVGQDWQGDVRVVLFVVLNKGATLDEALIQRIQARIRENCTPRHVPARILQVADIPRTKSGKITELAVRDVIHGREVKNKTALANPEALDLFRDRPELQS